jgi:hypothetical protein
MLSVRPPGIAEKWEDNNLWAQASMLAWSVLRQTEIVQFEESKLKALAGAKT